MIFLFHLNKIHCFVFYHPFIALFDLIILRDYFPRKMHVFRPIRHNSHKVPSNGSIRRLKGQERFSVTSIRLTFYSSTGRGLLQRSQDASRGYE